MRPVKAEKPITVVCRYCAESLVLNEDSEAARATGVDPLQQMRQHLEKKHLATGEVSEHARKMAWLLDMLFFSSPDDSDRWRRNIDKMVDYYQSAEAIS